jgi:GWxTD domain-containing protein
MRFVTLSRWLAGGLAAASMLLFVPPAHAAAQEPLTLHAYRFWRPPDNTLIEAYASIPLSLLSFARTGERDVAAFTATFNVKDADGLILTTQEWSDTIALSPMAEARMRASTTEHFTFQVKPGSYSIEVSVRDAGGENVWRAEHQVEAYSEPPRTGDLVLASELVRLESDSVAAAAEAIVRGTLAVVPNLRGALSMDRPSLALYTEVYRTGTESADSAQVWLELIGVNREFAYRTNPQLRVYPAGLGSEAFALSLAGLPPGEYRLALNIDVDDQPITIEHPLRMLPPGGGVIAVASALPYPEATSEQLDSIFEPMRWIAAQGEQQAFESLTSADSKRRFIARFWEQRAAASGMTYAEILQDWEARVTYVNQRFTPQTPGQGQRRTGAQTDRGRIYLRYGPPAERYTSGQTDDISVKACEAWQYTAGRGDRYVFWDRTGLGDFELVYSTDRNEPGVPGMERGFTSTGQLRCEPSGR